MSTVNILVDNSPSDESNARLRNGIVDFNSKMIDDKKNKTDLLTRYKFMPLKLSSIFVVT